jgi:hypothetical protein
MLQLKCRRSSLLVEGLYDMQLYGLTRVPAFQLGERIQLSFSLVAEDRWISAGISGIQWLLQCLLKLQQQPHYWDFGRQS